MESAVLLGIMGADYADWQGSSELMQMSWIDYANELTDKSINRGARSD